MGVQIPPWEGATLRGKSMPDNTLWRELCKNSWTDRDVIWIIDSCGPKEACIRSGSRFPCKGTIFRVKDMTGHARRHSAVSSAKTAEPIEMLFWLWARVGSRNCVLDGVQISQCEGAIFRETNVPGCARWRSAVSCAKWLNRSRYCLGCGLRWAEWSMCYIEGTLAPPGEYDLTIHVWQWCVISSNYFDHLFVLVVFICFFVYFVSKMTHRVSSGKLRAA